MSQVKDGEKWDRRNSASAKDDPDHVGQAKFEDSNIALIGSDADKKARKDASNFEEAWKDAGKKVGIQIWRIVQFKVAPYDPKQYGSFYDGDSYIVLNTYKLPNSDTLRYNVHFWLGKKSSQDERGTAAYKTVELDDHLDDLPVQYREVQGRESKVFLDIFGGQIKILRGGAESGFNHVKPENYKPRLFRLHPRNDKHVGLHECESLSCSSLDQKGVFILDAGLNLYQWNGEHSSQFDRFKASHIVQELREQRNGVPKVFVLDGTENYEDFWKLLGGIGQIAAEPVPSTLVESFTKSLYKLTDRNGQLEFTKVAEGTIKNILTSEDVYILDVGWEVFAWIGKRADKLERSKAQTRCVQYLKDQGRSVEEINIIRIPEGAEPSAFLEYFDK